MLVAGAVHEAVHDAVGAAGALGEALIAIKDQPDRTADWLSGVLHISQPGTAHLVAIAGALLGPEARDERLLAELCRLCDRSSCPRCPVHEGWQRASG